MSNLEEKITTNNPVQFIKAFGDSCFLETTTLLQDKPPLNCFK